MSANNTQFFFTMRNQIKLYHWQTKLYSRHKATDEVVDALDKSIDKYVEVYMGKYGRMKLNTTTSSFYLKNLSESSIVNFIKKCIVYLNNDLVIKLKDTDTDLLNIRDEMLAELNQLLYLFTLK
jgi:hypothetical protein